MQDDEINYQEVVREQGSIRKAAAHLGMAASTLQGKLKRMSELGYAMMPDDGVPAPGFRIVKHSVQLDKDGDLQKEWVGTKPDSGEAFEMLPGHAVKGESALLDGNGRVLTKWVKTTRDGSGNFVDAFLTAFSEHEVASPAIPSPEVSDDDTLTMYPLADLHFGMYSHGPETGANYDVDIATDIIIKNISALVAKSDPSKKAIILGLGDLFHQNDQKNATPGSGHRLDVDGRWERVYRKCAEMLLEVVEIVAQKHDEVEIVLLPGNHDEDASKCMKVALALFYRNNPRISVYEFPGNHWFGRFGKNLWGATHGHTMKPDRMAMMLATDRKEDWGQTDYKAFFFGHIHHETAKEVGPVRVESFNTPAAKDSYAAAGGYRSGRSMSAITYHREDGETGRHRVNIRADWAKIVPAKAA